MRTSCATSRCMTPVTASRSTQPTSLRNQTGRGGWTHPGCMSLRYSFVAFRIPYCPKSLNWAVISKDFTTIVHKKFANEVRTSSLIPYKKSPSIFPQLVSDDESGNMKALPFTGDNPPLVEDRQAVLEDYTDAVEYRRCPLNPDLHQADPDDKSSTYTLTNVVPLITDFLATSWNPYLDIIRRRLNNFCHGKSFIVTGVTVSGAIIKRDNRDRLAIPKHMWLAYCCPRFDQNSPYEVRFMFPSYGGYALNEQTDHSVLEVPLKTLESFLKSQTDIDSDMTIFYKGCVTENMLEKKRRDLTNHLV